MIRAYLDSNELVLHSNTAIGLTIENFNLSDLANRKIDRTNTISVPKAGNEAIFEFSSLPNAPTSFAYDDYDFDLLVDGQIIYKNAKAFIISEYDDFYRLSITYSKNIIDLLRSITLADLYSGDQVDLVTNVTFADLFTTKTNGFKIDYLFTEAGVIVASEYSWNPYGGGYLCIFLDTILDKIEADYDITFSGDLLTEAEFLDMRIPCVSANFKRDNGTNDIYVDDLVIHDSFTAWDLIKNVIQLFCAVFKIDGEDMELQKFNDLDTTTPIDWSGKLISSSKSFAIPDTAQYNYIRYQVADNVDERDNQAVILCNNVNIGYEKTLSDMKAKLFPFRDIQLSYLNHSTTPLLGISLPDYEADYPGLAGDPTPTRVKGLKDLVFFVTSDEYLGQPLDVKMAYWNEFAAGAWNNPILNDTIVTDAFTKLVKYYNPTANYSLVETMLTDPVLYDCEMLLNLVDILQFDPFKAIQVDELEGLFYANRIQNFIPTAPGTSTKVQLIKLS